MRAILGLGNPGSRYRLSRHNIGYILLDYLAEKHNFSFAEKGNYFYLKGELNNSPFLLIKPNTYMNNSGLAAKEIFDFYKITPSDLLVVYDDVYLKLGEIRIRQQGGDGGHNGLSSVIYHLNNNQFARLRIGIGSLEKIENLPNFVLGKLTSEEQKNLEPTIKLGTELIEQFCEKGVKGMLDLYSNRLLPKK